MSERARNKRWRAEVMADPERAARWRQQKRQWWRNNRAKLPIQVRVAP